MPGEDHDFRHRGVQPFWFWNGDIDEAGITRQLTLMWEQGIRGVFLHSRQGMRVPYMSHRFLELVDHARRETRRLGMTAHLYDEFPYPSGVAGGRVTLGDPQHCATRLVQRIYEVSDAEIYLPRGRVLNATLVPLSEGRPQWSRAESVIEHVGVRFLHETYNEASGLTRYNRRRYFETDPGPVLSFGGGLSADGEASRIYVSMQQTITDHKYWGVFIDPMNPSAVEAFLSETHDRYADYFGSAVADDFVSIFTDETFPEWSSLLPEAYRNRYGDELLTKLHALQDEAHPEFIELSRRLWELRLELFVGAFEKPLRDRCHRHGLRYSGEKPVLTLSQLGYMDIPGCDPGHTKAGDHPDVLGTSIRKNARAVYSVARFYGKAATLCECYHSLGWSATLQDAKLIADTLLLAGIDILVPHGFFYSTASLRKHDAPPSFFDQMPYWHLTRRMSEWIDRVQDAFADTVISADVVVFEPSEGLPTEAGLTAYGDLMWGLMEARRDFYVADSPMLELAPYPVELLVIPPLRYRPPALDRWIDAHPQTRIVELDAEDPAGGVRAVCDLIDSSVPLRVTDGPTSNLWVVTRRNETRGSSIWFAVNIGSVPLEVASKGPLLELEREFDTSRRPIGPAEAVSLAPFEAVLIRPESEHKRRSTERSPRFSLQEVHLSLDREWDFAPLDPNIVRLGEFELTIRTLDGSFESRTARVSSGPLENQLAESGLEIPVGFDFGFGVRPAPKLAELLLTYGTEFEVDDIADLVLIVERESVYGRWEIAVNGRAVSRDAFRDSVGPIPDAIEADISSHIVQGRNRITLSTSFDSSPPACGLLNPLYVAGDFAVNHFRDSVAVLSRRVASGRFHAFEENGLPYYSGAIDYTGTVTIDTEGAGADERLLTLGVPDSFTGSLEISINGCEPIAFPWSPYTSIVDAALFAPGENHLWVREYTSRERSFDGEAYDPVERICKPI